MAEVLLFHHAQGQTAGFLGFADDLRQAGQTVHTPDLFDGRTFATIEECMAYVQQVGCGEMIERGERAGGRAAPRARLRGLLARRPAGTEAGPDSPGGLRRAALRACRPRSSDPPGRRACRCRSTGWTRTPIFAGEGDIDAARELVASAEQVELFLYPSSPHNFADVSLPSYDPGATALLTSRVLDLLRSR
jgi:dienelactone hydrolase